MEKAKILNVFVLKDGLKMIEQAFFVMTIEYANYDCKDGSKIRKIQCRSWPHGFGDFTGATVHHQCSAIEMKRSLLANKQNDPKPKRNQKTSNKFMGNFL